MSEGAAVDMAETSGTERRPVGGRLILRDARMVRTDSVLRDTLLRLLTEKPFDSITIKEICEEARIYKSTFFRHHATKEAFLDHVVADELNDLVSLCIQTVEEIDHTAAFAALCDYIGERRAVWTALLNGGAGATIRAELLRISRELAATSNIPLDVPLELQTICVVSTIVEGLSWWLAQPIGSYDRQIAGILSKLLCSPMLHDRVQLGRSAE